MNTAAFSQKPRRIRLSTGLENDSLGVTHARGHEALSTLFEYEIDAVSATADIDFDKLIGHNATLSFETREKDTPRHINGFVSRAELTGIKDRHHGVRLTLRPWFWFLTLGQTCRIYEEKTAPEIITDVLEQQGFGDVEMRLQRSYPAYFYTVQYNESDFDFISRLMEREGIYYFFEHENGKHTLVLIDKMTSHAPYPGYEEMRFSQAAADDSLAEESIYLWQNGREVRPTAVSLGDWDFEKPSVDLLSESNKPRSHGLASRMIYEYPALFKEADIGKEYSKLRLEEAQTRYETFAGQGSVRGVTPGAEFELVEHPVAAMNGKYMVVSVEHRLSASAYESGGQRAEDIECAFTAISTDHVFRPERKTPAPRISGLQTAMVTGDDGEEIDPDEHMRVLVKFHWLPDTPSCRVRVSQMFVGAGYGAQVIPRIGDEVIVAFEDGDPDRPLIVGSLYNGASAPPFDPMAKRNVIGFRSNSTKGGGGANEFYLDDTKDEEQIFLHAQKNFDERVLENKTVTIVKDLAHKVENDAFVETMNASHESVGDSQYLDVAADRHITVGGDNSRSVGDTEHLNAGGDILNTAATNIVHKAGNVVHAVASDIVLEGSTSVTLVVGGSFVHVASAGVTISGPMVKINSGGSPGSGPGTEAGEATAPVKPGDAKEAGQGAAAEKYAHERRVTEDEIDANPTARALKEAAKAGAPFCEECARQAAERENAARRSSSGGGAGGGREEEEEEMQM